MTMSDLNEQEKQDATARLLEAILPANHKGWHSFCAIEYDIASQRCVGVLAVYPDYTLSLRPAGWMATASGESIAEVERGLADHIGKIICLPPPSPSSSPSPVSPVHSSAPPSA